MVLLANLICKTGLDECRTRSFARNRDGAAAVEFAIIAPVFLLIAAAILFYGVYFGARHSTAQIAADAARASVAGLTDTERAEIAIAHVSRTAGEYPLIAAENVANANSVGTSPTEEPFRRRIPRVNRARNRGRRMVVRRP